MSVPAFMPTPSSIRTAASSLVPVSRMTIGTLTVNCFVAALKIVTADPNVKAILFNIFGGITRCDDVANGIVAATKQFTVKVPIVIRLTGTNEDAAVKILEGVGMKAMTDMDQAVQRAVDVARKGGAAA